METELYTETDFSYSSHISSFNNLIARELQFFFYNLVGRELFFTLLQSRWNGNFFILRKFKWKGTFSYHPTI